MAKYNINASGNQLIIEQLVTLGDFNPSITSFKSPSIKLTTDKIKFYESGIYAMALSFVQINEIDGVAPTDLEDAADKITALIANFNGGGTAPYATLNPTTSVLNASDLNTQYPDATTGFTVIAPNVIGGGKLYIKGGTSWYYQQILLVV